MLPPTPPLFLTVPTTFMFFFHVQITTTAHTQDFSKHVLDHSAAVESPALRPPGCPLRAYGCCACGALRATATAVTTTTTTATARISSSTAAAATLDTTRREVGVGGEGSGDNPGGLEHGCSARPLRREEEEGIEEQEEGVGVGDGRKEKGLGEAAQERGHIHGNPGRCPWYRVVCKSCEREVRASSVFFVNKSC